MQMNEAQHKAVSHKDGPMLVLAGPGSGKTFVITERTRYLIDECHIPEEQILVITFTKAAAREMKERFLLLKNTDRTGVNFGTFHAVFFTILRRAYHLNADNIVKDDIKLQYMREIIHRMQLEYEDEKEFINDLSSEISLVKGNRMDLANYYSIHLSDEIFRSIYTEYNNRLRKSNLIDFDDMLLLCYELLSKRKDILEAWQSKFRYILVDEFQDINMVQYEIVRMLAKPQNNLFIVGDDDQSIYRFRGAKPEIMLNFPKDYPECKKVTLSINYRCASGVIEAANQLIQRNQSRFQKKVEAAKREPGVLLVRQFDTLVQENQSICEEIRRRNKEGVPLSDMAVLIRTNHGSGALIHKLMEYNIPFQMKDNIPNLFDHWIAGDIIAYIELARGSTRRSDFLRIINRPKRYIARDCFDAPEVDLEAVKDYYEDKEWMLDRLEQLEYDLAILSKMLPYAAVNYIRRGIGYEGYLKEYAEQRKIKAEELFDILEELQESTRECKTYEEWFAYMEQYRDELKRQLKAAKERQTDSLMLATMHSSKGLEYDTVFIADANEGITPHKKAALPEDLEEERRLFYVAMTRAKQALLIYSAKERYNKVSERSRFIDELLGIKPNQ